jgi:YfiH family protein
LNDPRRAGGEAVEALRSPLLAGTAHGFLGRRGGVSAGIHGGLNVGLGSDDDRAAVAENRRRAIAAVLPGARLVTVHQVHSAEAVTLAEPWGDEARPRADALVTALPGVLLGILTADCAPVLLADVAARVVGAAHAGWKGAFGGVVEATVAAMERLGARRERIAAAVGPCIAQASYEVDDAFVARFVAAGAGNARFFAAGRPGHARFDLPGYVLSRLGEAGVGRAEWLGEDTYPQPERFFSYRRATHRGEPDYGRQISLIGLPGLSISRQGNHLPTSDRRRKQDPREASAPARARPARA